MAKPPPTESANRGESVGTSLPRQPVLLITGMSGAGLSTALKTFEDLGYEAVDNMRLGLIPALINDPDGDRRPLAVAIDTRNANFSADTLLEMLRQLQQLPQLDARLIFFDCADEALQRRFTETRRRHPLAIDRPVTDGIERERSLIQQLHDAADHVVDTSQLSIHDLRRLIAGHYRLDHRVGLTLYITSFSFRHGIPREADMVFDVRFLRNPHWDPVLRPKTGLDDDVAAYIRQDGDYSTFMDHVTALVLPLLPRYQQEGKSYLTLAMGCTGGRHRSVLAAEELSNRLAVHGFIVGVGHRDIDKTGK